jgi:ankyrin repeat protein
MAQPADSAAEADIFYAIRTGDVTKVSELLDADPTSANSTDAQGLSPLTVATYHGQANIVDLLLARGAADDVFAATARGDRGAVEFLLRENPDLVRAHSSDGWTALALAAHFGRLEILQILLGFGADPNAVSHNLLGNTPLHAAIAGNQREAVSLLLQNGANPNGVDSGGWTPLHLAAHSGADSIARDLLEAGADPTIPNAQGDTPLSTARQQRHGKVASLLTRAGAAPQA